MGTAGASPEDNEPVTGPADAATGRRRIAKGPRRPVYFESAETDRVMIALVALMSEVSALRDRIDTHERLADEGALPSRELVETYRPDAGGDADREVERNRMIQRVLRVLLEQLHED